METFQKVIENNRAPLTLEERCWFWFNPSALLFAGAFFLTQLNGPDWLVFIHGTRNPTALFFLNAAFVIMICVGAYLVYVNRNMSRLTFMPSKISVPKKEELLLKVHEELGWKLLRRDVQFLKFYEPSAFWLWRNITKVVYDDNGFYVNCVHGNGAMFTTRESEDAVEEILRRLKELENPSPFVKGIRNAAPSDTPKE